MSPDPAILAAVATPLIGAGVISFCRRWPNVREAVTLTTATLLFAFVLSLLPDVLAGATPGYRLFEVLPGLTIAFAVEPLGMLFALVASLLWIVTSVYSIGYMRGNREANQTRFYACFAIALASAVGIAFSANLLTLFLFYEALTLSTYPLVIHKGDAAARAGGRTYLGLLLSTSIAFLLLAIIWTWSIAGTLEFQRGGILAGKVEGIPVSVLLALYMFGIGKAALMPFHRWLPAAMVAPTPVSALLHAVAVVKAGVFAVVKVIVYVFGTEFLVHSGGASWLVYVAGATIVIASIVALQQDNLKLRLAYSTVSQLSYVILATALLTPAAVVAATLHIAAHAFGKITLFFAAGSIYTAAHKTRVSELDGIGRQMPVTMVAFAVGALSMMGLPLTAGFLSKWYLLRSALATETTFALAVIVLSTLLNAAYYLPIVHAAFFRSPKRPGRQHDQGEAPLPIVAALAVTAVLTIWMFLFPDPALQLAQLLVAGGGR